MTRFNPAQDPPDPTLAFPNAIGPKLSAPDPPDPALADLDAALIGLRRLWAAPPRLSDPALGTVEMSTIWIVDALDGLDHRPEVTVADVAAAIDVAPSTASRLIERAEAAGCVSRHRSATDTRRTLVASTPAGRTLAGVARTARTTYLAEVTADWTPDQRRTLVELLSRFALAVHATPPHPDGGTPRKSPGSAPPAAQARSCRPTCWDADTR